MKKAGADNIDVSDAARLPNALAKAKGAKLTTDPNSATQ